MEKLLLKSKTLVEGTGSSPQRFLYDKIDWNDRLIGLLGARGTGKTTLLLQRLKQEHGLKSSGLYLSLDDVYFTEHRFIDVAEFFLKHGGETLYVDEVHRYPGWSKEIKNLYDFYKELKIIYTGSSIIELAKQDADLSRRAVQYSLPGLSFREYLLFSGEGHYPNYSLKEIIANHDEIAREITQQLKPLVHFEHYLKHGYYPFFKENINTYTIRLEQLVRMIVEHDLAQLKGFEAHNARKVLQLLQILAVNVPFKPNISKLAQKIDIHRNTLIQYLHYLEKVRLINGLQTAGKSISTLQKPDKLFLENTNVMNALGDDQVNTGSLRESFFLNQLINAHHNVSLPKQGDFIVDNHYTFEIGGKQKTGKQIQTVPDSYVVSDKLETGVLNKIPLWLFGFLY